MNAPRPFLKWAGGKTSLLPEILKRAPKKFDTYREPFVGGGAVLFALAPERAVISDSNHALINAWFAVRDRCDALIDLLQEHGRRHVMHGEKHFYLIRDRFNQHRPGAAGAAHLIYLNKTCFNGLYRVNASGEFNVPFGRYKNPTICDEANLRACSAFLQERDVHISHEGFRSALCAAGRGDFIYADPPYLIPGFTAYTTGKGQGIHGNLRDSLADAAKRGARVLLSSADNQESRQLWRGRGWKIQRVASPGSIAASAADRGRRPELLISSPNLKPRGAQ